MPYVLRNILGLKFKVIAGYPGGSEMNLAMQRGEVDGRGTFSWTSLKPHYKQWVESGDMAICYQMGLRKHPICPKCRWLPNWPKTIPTEGARRCNSRAFELGRPYFLPEGVPADRVQPCGAPSTRP